MNHLPFIIASYAAAAIILGALIVATWLDFRSQKRRLSQQGRSLDSDKA